MTESLKNLLIRPEVQIEGLAAADLLSQVLAKIRLTGDYVYTASFKQNETVDLNEQSAHVCMLRHGSLQIRIGSDPAITMQPGDVLLLPHSSSETRLTTGGEQTEVAICRFWFDASSFEAMVFALPSAILIAKDDAEAWSEGILHFILLEADNAHPGGALMVSRLIDLVVIRILRTWVHQKSASGWLRALSDPRIARTLKAIHETPGQQWSINALAELAGMSRSNFCTRFNNLVGRPPLRYQNEWRLSLARTMLVRGDSRIGEVGFLVGYESEAAFSRAYKSFFGCSPREDTSRLSINNAN